MPNYLPSDYVRAFTEWERRYREDPDGFEAEFPTAGDYGTAAAEYFSKLLAEIVQA